MHIRTQLDVDVVALQTDDTVTVLLELVAPAAPEPDPAQAPAERTAVVVLDRSGSMAGPRLDAAKRALRDLVARLDDRDRFGLVVFDDQAHVEIPAERVAEVGRDNLRHTITALRPGGSTDLSSGYLRGLQEARRVCGPTGATLVLLSDGFANVGVMDPDRLEGLAASALEHAVSTSTIGIGTDYDDALLLALSRGGAGNHAFAEHADAAAAALGAELDGLLSKTVQAANLLIAPTDDVATVTLHHRGLRAQQVAGGALVELGDFYAGEERKVLVTVEVPAAAALGLAQVASLTLQYVELPALVQRTVTVPVVVNVVPGDEAAGRVPRPAVVRERLLQDAQQAKRQSRDHLRTGDAAAAREVLAGATARISADPPLIDDELQGELDWLGGTLSMLVERGEAATARRVTSDWSRKSRGYKTRPQGGQWDVQPPSATSGDDLEEPSA